jgi:hypothetical protein
MPTSCSGSHTLTQHAVSRLKFREHSTRNANFINARKKRQFSCFQKCELMQNFESSLKLVHKDKEDK